MAMNINTNVASLNAQRNLGASQSSLATSLQRLSSGLRINSAKDDAAGLAISTRMSAQINGLNQAASNANDGISMAQTAEGAMSQVGDLLLRMRDLAVQSANDSYSDTDRMSLQNEVDQLSAEIDRISGTTEFNGVKLLNGTALNRTFQVGANAGQTISFSINEVSTKSLALNSSSNLGDLNGGRISATGAADGDLVINGVAVDFAAASADNSIKEFKDAINAVSGQTGVSASAYNIVKGNAGATGVTSGLMITVDAANGTAGTAVTVDNSSSMSELVNNINKQVGGVTATIGTDGGLVLSNDNGGKITISGTVGGSGLTSGGFEGYLSLKATGGKAVTLSTASGTAASALNKFGFNSSSGNTGLTSSGVTSAAGVDAAAVTTLLNTAQPSFDPTTVATDIMTINGVAVGKTASGSAADKAVAINAISSQTGVKASAETKLYLNLNLDAATVGDIAINGTVVDLTAGTDVDVEDVVTKINASGLQGVIASVDQSTGRLLLTSNSGADIVVENDPAAGAGTTITGAATSATASFTAVAAGQAIGARGSITLTGQDGATVRVDGNATGIAKFGLVGQGGNSEAVGGKLSITTTAGASQAITRIDDAIQNLATQRATMGAVQNRLTSTIANLQTSSENLSAARSRIQDTDFAAETAKMTRSQILQQAGTAMLAQANQLPQAVLSLLR